MDGATLVMSDRQGIEIDYCPECRGVWLDRGELDKLVERERQWVESQVDDARGRASAEPEKPAKPEKTKKKKVSSFRQDLMEMGQN